MRDKAINALIKLGIPADIKGFDYIVEAMCLFENPSWRNGKQMALYHKIATLHNTTSERVERAMRHAFSTVYKSGNDVMIGRYLTFQNCTNGNLLHVLYLRLTQEG